MDPIDLPLRDIHLPAPISWWPLAIGWWILIGCCFFSLSALIIGIKMWTRQTVKKQALKTLETIEKAFHETGDALLCISELSILLRRVVITRNSKSGGVTGKAWLQLLDPPHSTEFSEGAGKILLTGPYQRDVDSEEVAALLALCRKRVKQL